MSELSNRTRGIVATGLAIGALIGGATEAKAAPSHPTNQPEAATLLDNQPEHRLSLEEVTAQTLESLKSGQEVNYYRGWVNIEEHGTDNVKFAIQNPFIIYRSGAAPDKLDFAANHPRSKYWAIGYIQRGTKGNLGDNNLVLLPFNSNGNNFIFNKERSKAPDPKSAIDLVKFHGNSDGSLDLAQPFNIEDQPIVDYDGHPAAIAYGFNK